MNKLFLAALLAAGLVGGASLSQAKEWEHTPQDHELFQGLNLKAEQKTQLQEIRKTHREQIQNLRNKKKELREKLDKAMIAETASPELKKIHSEFLDTDHKLRTLRFDQMLAVRDILTPEQRKKFKEMHGKGPHAPGRRGAPPPHDDDED
jgi:Spy/CpxP family protein refolding chaperone